MSGFLRPEIAPILGGRSASPCSPGSTGWPSCGSNQDWSWSYTIFYEGDSETFFDYARALVPLTIYGPVNLALANNPQADGTFSRAFLTAKAQSGVLDLADPQHLEFILHGGRITWSWIREHPGDFGRLVLRKQGLFFSAWTLGWTQWDWPGGLNGVRRPVDVFTPESGAGWGLGLPLAVLGLVCCLATPGGARRWAVLVAGQAYLDRDQAVYLKVLP